MGQLLSFTGAKFVLILQNVPLGDVVYVMH